MDFVDDDDDEEYNNINLLLVFCLEFKFRMSRFERMVKKVKFGFI